MTDKTFFGLPIIDDNMVRVADIAKLPFFDFWRESARGSTQIIVDGEVHVHLHDWQSFCRHFIRTGQHRFQE